MIMKKFFTVAAVLLVLTMTACGGNSGTEETETAETTVSAADATTTTAETTATTSGTTAAETESKTEASTESADAENIFRGTGYTLTIDPADWEDNTEQFAELSSYLDAVFVHTNEGKATLTFSPWTLAAADI